MIIRPYEGKQPRVGERVFLAESCAVIGDVAIGDDASIWYGVVLRGDIHYIRIGQRTNIQDNAVLHVEHETGPAIIGDEVTVGHSATVHGCTIGSGSLIGIGATVLSHAVVGERALIGAGALVPEGMHVPPGTLVLGVPGRVKRNLTQQELGRLEQSWRHYVDYKDRYLKS